MFNIFIVSINKTSGEIVYNMKNNFAEVYVAYITADSIITINSQPATLEDINENRFEQSAEIRLDSTGDIVTRLNII